MTNLWHNFRENKQSLKQNFPSFERDFAFYKKIRLFWNKSLILTKKNSIFLRGGGGSLSLPFLDHGYNFKTLNSLIVTKSTITYFMWLKELALILWFLCCLNFEIFHASNSISDQWCLGNNIIRMYFYNDNHSLILGDSGCIGYYCSCSHQPLTKPIGRIDSLTYKLARHFDETWRI